MADASMFPPPVNPSDPGKGPMIIGVTWMLTSIAVIVFALRIYVRTRSPSQPGLDDWFMGVAVFFQLIAQSLTTRAYHYGMGKHDADLWFDPQIINILKYGWVQLPFGVMVSIFARFSITVLLIRIFNRVTWLKVYLIVFTTLLTIGGIMVIITVFAQVTPVEALWNPTIQAQRWDPRIQVYTAYTAGALLAFSDLTYGLFPTFLVWTLQLPLKKKLSLAIILALSVVTCVAAIMKVVVAQQASELKADIQYHTVQAIPWTYAEQCLVIILGSAPVFASRIMSVNLPSSLRKLWSLTSWSKKSFGTTQSTYSNLGPKVEVSSSTFGDYSDGQANRSMLKQDVADDDTTIMRTHEYAVTYIPR